MFVKFIGTDRNEVAVNSHQVTFISPVSSGTRIPLRGRTQRHRDRAGR